jgi:hypothetical protein
MKKKKDSNEERNDGAGSTIYTNEIDVISIIGYGRKKLKKKFKKILYKSLGNLLEGCFQCF